MKITVLGLIVLPLGVYLFAKGTRPLFWATVWAIPFFDTIILFLPFAPVRPFQYLAGLLMVRYVINMLVQGQEPVVRRSSAVLVALGFILSLVASLFMPLLLSTPIYIVPEGHVDLWKAYQNPKLLRFGLSNLTQLAYPVFGVSLFLTIEWSIWSKRDLKRVVRILVKAFFILGGFMVLYQLAYLIGIEAPVDFLFFLFQGEADASFSGYNALAGLIRAHTPAGEPGYTGLYYGIVLSLVMGLSYGGYVKGWRFNRQLTGLILVSIVLNASTTGFFSVVVILGSFIVVSLLRRNGRVMARSNVRTMVQLLLVLTVTSATVLAVAQTFGISLVEILVTQHLEKITEGAGSGAFRLKTIFYTMEEVFPKSPILGVGYGSHRALSLIVFLIANVGVVGVGMFFLLNGVVFVHVVRVMNKTVDPELASIAFALSVTHMSLLIILMVKGSVGFVSGWLWLFLGLSEACYRLYRSRERSVAIQ
ncbi:hypothetical protein [Salinibacter ruber]|uniref:hypothetical protein n=1 Tax=Salinibacter ruber TaxID=146919 RepID=UPI0021672396|nr:hypothetical protein [Salinibacter ruber]MCS3655575.1 hypothetical protein [Salinibacter ruber]MCS4116733.1 hypothetical protein [Salinibacter ruber]MCS4152848.1 hypothetical protein [Salinibacter ruber]MCS4168661.1 hypothetical protein [Salinibacter ruber]MCS4185433.1 hypothetical protein [Salinibacter ruber]